MLRTFLLIFGHEHWKTFGPLGPLKLNLDEAHEIVHADASTHDFPSAEPSGLRTDFAPGTGVVTAEQAQIAQNAEDVLHAIATDDAAKFCPLIDPVDLQKLLKEKSLASCNDIKLRSTADSPVYQSFAVENPAAITVSGDTAHIPAVAIVPTSFGAVDMRKDTDGSWKFRFYST